MTVRELIEELKTCNQDAVVIKSRDEEGNGYEEVTEISDNRAIPSADGYIEECYFKTLTHDLEKEGFTEEDVLEDGLEVIILW